MCKVPAYTVRDAEGNEVAEPDLDTVFGFAVTGEAPNLVRALAQTVADLASMPNCPDCKALSNHAL